MLFDDNKALGLQLVEGPCCGIAIYTDALGGLTNAEPYLAVVIGIRTTPF